MSGASASIALARGARLHHLPLDFPLAHGDRLAPGLLGYELSGPADGPLVVVLGGISAGRHVVATAEDPRPGWWPAQVGPGRPIDTERCRVLGLDWLGGAGASSGPDNTSGTRAERFPLVTSTDQARALLSLLDALAIERIDRFVGSSYGGMVALAFAALAPRRVAALTVISAAHESHPRASAWRSLQRRIVELGVASDRGSEALAIARGLALTTYRSRRELAERFAAPAQVEDGRARFAVEGYLEARGRDFVARFSPATFLALSLAIDLHRIDPAPITAPATLVAATTDELVPIEQMRQLARQVGGTARLVEIETIYGHDAFLKEDVAIGALLAADLRATLGTAREVAA